MEIESIFRNITGVTCLQQLTEELNTLEVLKRLNPGNDDVWTSISQDSMNLLTAAFMILGLVYFSLGLISTGLLLKFGSLRVPVRTFFAVYLNMAILGYSRALFLWLDPGGMIGFISSHFSGWIVVSRYLNAPGFPSLVASSTMIIFTLIKVVDTKTAKKWYEYWRYVILIVVLAYSISFLAESLGHINSLAAIISGTLCKIFFIIWGATVCTIYLTAGFRLLLKIKMCHTLSMKLSDSQTEPQDLSKDLCKSRRMKRIFRRIIKITIGTALTGLVYSLVAAGDIAMTFYLVFYQCIGSVTRGNTTAWILLQWSNGVIEIIMSVFILYSITDVTKITSAFKNCARNVRRFCCSWRTSPENIYPSKTFIASSL